MNHFYRIFAAGLLIFVGMQVSMAQKFMGVGTDKPSPRAVLELRVEDPAGYQQGFLPPRLTTAQRTNTAFQTAIATLKGMTVYDTDIDAYFVWNGTIWVQLAASGGALNLTAVGINGALVTTSGLAFTVDGSNFVLNTQNVPIADIEGNYTNGFTVTGIKNYNIVGDPAAGNVLSFNGTNFVFANLPSVTSQATSITGIDGITVAGTGFDLTIGGNNLVTGASTFEATSDLDGTVLNALIKDNTITTTKILDNAVTANKLANGIVTTLTGLNGITIDQNGQAFTINGPSFTSQATSITGIDGITVAGTGFDLTIGGNNLLNTSSAAFGPDLTGAYGLISVSGVKGYPIAGAPAAGNIISFTGTQFEFVTPTNNITLQGQAGVKTAQTGSNYAVSVSGLSLFTQSFPNPIGTVYSGTLGTGNPLMRIPIFLPDGVKKIKCTANAYLNVTGFNADVRFVIGSTNIDITGITSDAVTNFQSASNATDFTLASTNTDYIVSVFATTNDVLYLQGVKIEVIE